MSEGQPSIRNKGIKEKTISGLFWSFTDNAANQSVHFIVGIILARILDPAEFGLIGMLTVFIAVSQSFVDSGFQQALIRKKDAVDIDFSTVFYFNLVVGILFYLILFFCAGTISRFYSEPQLTDIIRVSGLALVINAFALIQRARLVRAINFRLQTKISFTSSLLSGIIGIFMAYKGFGVWSLVWRTLLNQLFQTISLWLYNRWIPLLKFSLQSFKEMFIFGSRLLLSGLIDTLYNNIYYLVIGKYFSASDLGYYTRADQFNKLASSNITSTIQKVSFPVLSTLQDDNHKLKKGYKKLITNIVFITSILMFGMAAMAKPMILTLIGDKWFQSIIYLQLLCFNGLLYPLHAINLNVLNVKGRSDLFLRLEIIKKSISIPIIIIGIVTNITTMIAGMIVFSFGAYFLNSYYSGKLINYPIKEQIKDILPAFLFAFSIAVPTFVISLVLKLAPIYILMIQIFITGFLTISLGEIFRLESYVEIKTIILDKAKQLLGRKNSI